MFEKQFVVLKSLSALAVFFFAGIAQAGSTTCDSIASGSWSDTNTWSCNTGSGIPVSDTFVNINSPHAVLLDVDATVTQVVVAAGGDLNVAASPGGLTLSWISNASDISAASIDLLGDFTINALAGAPIDLVLGAVDGAFDLSLNAEGNTIINGPIGANTPLNSIDTDQDGSITLGHSITTTSSILLDENMVTLIGDVTLSGSSVSVRGAVNADVDAPNRHLVIDANGFSQITGVIGAITPISSLTTNTNSSFALEGHVTTTGAQIYNNDLILQASVNLTGSTVEFHGGISSQTIAATGYDLTVTGDANFTADIGNTVFRGGNPNLNSIIVTGHADFTVGGDGADIVTDGLQIYNNSLSIGSDARFTSLNGGIIIIRDSGGAHHLSVNTSANTFFRGTVGNPRHTSITTDAAGATRFSGGLINLQVNGAEATTFNDDVVVGASGDVVIDQLGTGDLVFNGSVTQLSGSPHALTVNDVSGQTIFNGLVAVGELTTNDGTGDDVTVINAPNITTNQGGADNGQMIFNDPVLLMQDVVFAENNAGQIVFNNTLDAADGVGDIDVTINSDNEVILGAVGTNNALSSLVTDAAGSTTLNGHVLGDTPVTFNDAVVLGQSVRVSGEDVDFNGAVDLQTFDLTVVTVDGTLNGVISGSGNLISDALTSLRLNGVNTYTGQTIVNSGALNLFAAPSNNNISQSSAIVLAAGTFFLPHGPTLSFDMANGQTLSGAGTVTQTFRASSGAVVSPGFSPGLLSFTNFSLATGSTYQVEIDGLVPGTEHDQVVATEVELDRFLSGGATLAVNFNSAFQLDDEIVIINNTGVNPVVGLFDGLAEGGTVTTTAGGVDVKISYAGGDGNDVVLTGACSAAITVLNGDDSGAGSLRQAVLDSCPGGTIDFAADTTVSLSSEILVDQPVTIDASGRLVVLDGNAMSRIFNVAGSGDLSLVSLTVSNGFSSDSGGAIFNEGVLTVTDSTFNGNISGDINIAGGAIFNAASGAVTIAASTFINNTGNRGGAIFNSENGPEEGMLTISNSTFTQNGSDAFEGGAIHNRGVLVSTNNTFAGNGAINTLGGGVYTWNGDISLNNTIVADSIGGSDCFIENSNSVESNSNSLIENGNCDAALSLDPQLQALSDNGGNTLTMALSLVSPAVDAGSNALCTTADQRGVSRPQLAACDIGAYETEYLGIIYVGDGVVNRGDSCMLGACWENAYTDLQDAFVAVGPGSEIWVKAGLYFPDEGQFVNDGDPTQSFFVSEGVALYGGFNGTETAREQRDPHNNITILSGDIDGNDVNTDGNGVAESVTDITGLNSYNVIVTTGGGVTIDGFTITAGYANGPVLPAQRGGAVNCHIASSGSNVFANNVMIGNHASNAGGAMYGCNSQVVDSMFVANQSDGFAGALGFTAAASLENVSFLNNVAATDSGAIRAVGLDVDRGYFAGNRAGTAGGAIFSVAGTNIKNSLFTGNLAVGEAGALNLRNNNTLTNVTLTGNVAMNVGGAIFYDDGPIFRGDALGLYNSVIWNNQDSTGTGTLTAGVTTDSGVYVANSLFQGSGGSTSWNPAAGTDGGNNIDLDPEFVQDVDLMLVPTTQGDARATLGSAIIESGDNGFVDTAFDLDGKARIFGPAVDMGPYEYVDLIFADGFDQ